MWEAIKKFGADLVEAFKDMLKDLVVWVVELLLDVGIHVLESLSVPSELLTFTISELVSPDVSYFLVLTGLNQCMVIIGAAYLFRIVRKFVTFGFW